MITPLTAAICTQLLPPAAPPPPIRRAGIVRLMLGLAFLAGVVGALSDTPAEKVPGGLAQVASASD
ncbi:hypothetical protein MASR2M74_02230 [Paracoccaceae bacterium]